ncbi:uncharacterized protein PHACADRAFT_176081 [Phanerochaete carnosa HHB-10118-sp]|uniref:Protein kinase domain-containing protein n=1 Tax=Phanerochaete carnosa (strain HHB-10118-sp) TaxID=650164 RepID=K5UUI1_PHACS|nr:uncharacterized protein PHACADRAFT_176081 [Phanerochaete carnosa HHB-10118-sp]EKM53671.1 hypothetical protein PHACADRAFT_176081 [Phanerochaete carnosa HHB-10118-sp]
MWRDVRHNSPLFLQHKVDSLGEAQTPYIVKIFDPRFMRNARRCPWRHIAEAKAARIHGGQLQFDPRERPDGPDVDYEESPQKCELAHFRVAAWMHHNECLAYKHLARLQGSTVPIFYGSGTLDLSGTKPPRAVNPFVIFLEYIHDAIPLATIDPLRLTEPLMRSFINSGDCLSSEGVIDAGASWADILLVPAHNPTRVVVIDFANSWTRDAAADGGDWEGGKREWPMEQPRKAMLSVKFKTAAFHNSLPVPDVVELPVY